MSTTQRITEGSVVTSTSTIASCDLCGRLHVPEPETDPRVCVSCDIAPMGPGVSFTFCLDLSHRERIRLLARPESDIRDLQRVSPR